MNEYMYIIVRILITIGIFGGLAFVAKNYLEKWIGKLPTIKQKIPLFVSKLLFIAILILGVISILDIMGVDLKGLIAGLGLTGFIIGFALKDLLSSVISGFILTANNNIKIGDIITYKEIRGEVKKIEIRHIELIGSDTKKHYIANSKLLSEYYTVESKTK
jgi:small conductance mechanosensitive channel